MKKVRIVCELDLKECCGRMGGEVTEEDIKEWIRGDIEWESGMGEGVVEEVLEQTKKALEAWAR